MSNFDNLISVGCQQRFRLDIRIALNLSDIIKQIDREFQIIKKKSILNDI